jgi:alpha-L-fucosidase
MKMRGASSIHFMILGASAALALGTGRVLAQTQPTSYTPDWTSVNQHPAAPEWFQDAKLGIWYHWGAFTTPQFYGEWYPHYIYDKNDSGGVYPHHLNTYGDPFADWPYDKFITGANDKKGNFVQFAPKPVSAGGKWDPDAWAQLFVDAGARFAGVQMEHHDGFSMWDSKVNEWNAASKGPMLNIAKLHSDAFRKRGLKIMAAFHHAYNFQGYWQLAPKQTDPGLQKLYGQLSAAAENQLWVDKLKEVVDEFQPDIVYQDSFTPQIVLTESSLLQFATYYYNAALSWKKEVVALYKDGYNNKGEVYDYERGGPADIATPYWTTDDTIGPNTWGYVVGMTYFPPAAIVHAFIDRVSKNGNLLLNICPMADGTIPKEQQDILKAMGAFLKQFGTAIYETRAWSVYGEGPTKMGGCSICSPSAGTAQDVRYTKSKDGDAVYAILLGWPGNGKQVNLTSVTTSRFAVGSGKVFLFASVGGSATSLQFTQDSSGLHVTLPSVQPYTAIAYAMKISKSGTEPAPTPWLASDTTDAGVPAGDASDGSADVAAGAGGSVGTGGRSGAGGATGTNPTSSGGAAGASSSGGTGGRGGTGGATGTNPTSSGGAAGSGGSSGSSASGGSAGNADAAVSTAGSNASGGRGTGGMSTGAGGSGHDSSPAGASSSSGCSCDIQARPKATAANPLLFLGIVVVGGICRRRFAALGSCRGGRR